jgi:hypothetical protein
MSNMTSVPTFFRSGPWAAGWLLLVEEGERAALNFERKDFAIVQQDQVRDPSPTNRAVSIRCRMFSVMSELGHFRTSALSQAISALPRRTDVGDGRCDVRFVPQAGFRSPRTEELLMTKI